MRANHRESNRRILKRWCAVLMPFPINEMVDANPILPFSCDPSLSRAHLCNRRNNKAILRQEWCLRSNCLPGVAVELREISARSCLWVMIIEHAPEPAILRVQQTETKRLHILRQRPALPRICGIAMDGELL